MIDALIVIVVLIALTYPLSFLLGLLGVLATDPRRGGRVQRAFQRANDVAAAHALMILAALLMGQAAAFAAAILITMVGGCLVMAGAMEPVDNTITTPVLLVMLGIHVVAQAWAYRTAILGSSPH